MQTVFLFAAPFAVIGFLVTLFLREQRLDIRQVDPADVADSSFDVHEGA